MGTLVDPGDVNGYVNSISLLISKIIIFLSKNQKGYTKGIYLLLCHTAGFVCEALICANFVRCGGLVDLILQLCMLRLYLCFNSVIAARVTVLCSCGLINLYLFTSSYFKKVDILILLLCSAWSGSRFCTFSITTTVQHFSNVCWPNTLVNVVSCGHTAYSDSIAHAEGDERLRHLIFQKGSQL